MDAPDERPAWSLPFRSPVPSDPRLARRVRVARIVAYGLLIGALLTPVVQFQVLTRRTIRKRAEYERRLVAGTIKPDTKPPSYKGAIFRWSRAIRPFWAGRNIYLQRKYDDADSTYHPWLHPHMPLTVMLLTPLACLPPQLLAAVFSALKLLAAISAILMAARLAGHGERRVADWVVALGVLWAIALIIGDVRHGNTNVFVLWAVVYHLWLYRRGRDLAAGVPLALAICLKMTPALFVVYWLYQRNWKLLAATAVAGVVMAVIVPAAVLGPSHYGTLTETWLDNLILPGLVESKWYPIHVNQSLTGVAGRYFLDGPNGDILWNPDDNPYTRQDTHAWITLASLSPATVKMIVRAGQVAIVALAAWAIGWRKLPRDDGRRALHYALVLLAIMLLNQRTWDHHGAVLVPAGVAIWQAIAFGRFSRKVRGAAIALAFAAALIDCNGMGVIGRRGGCCGGLSLNTGRWARPGCSCVTTWATSTRPSPRCQTP